MSIYKCSFSLYLSVPLNFISTVSIAGRSESEEYQNTRALHMRMDYGYIPMSVMKPAS